MERRSVEVSPNQIHWDISPGNLGLFIPDVPKQREVIVAPEEIYSPYSEIIYNNDPTPKEIREHQLKIKNQRKWERVESVKDQKKKNCDNRDLFLIKAGTDIENSKSKKAKGDFFKGKLKDDVLAVINKKNKKLELIRFFVSEPIVITYLTRSGEIKYNCIDLVDKRNVGRVHDSENKKVVFISQKTPHQSLKNVPDIEAFLNLLAKR